MNIDIGSFAFGSTIISGGGTPSWGTALGQSQGYRITYEGAEVIVVGMVYNSVPLSTVKLPLGKGGSIYTASNAPECQLAALFRKVYINEKPVNYPFIIVLIKETSASHTGRRSIKYSDKNEYTCGGEHFENKEFVKKAREALSVEDDACWFVYAIEVINQDELHMYAVIVNSDTNMAYENSSERKQKWMALIPDTIVLDKKYYRGESDEDDALQQIFYGAPGTGKSHRIKELTEGKTVIRTTFHPDSDYSTFVGCYKPSMKVNVISKNGVSNKEEQIVYKFVPQAFTRAYVEAWKSKEEVFLVIEEINRGNCAQIFGDLFQLLDRKEGESEYPVYADTDLQSYLKEALAESEQDMPEVVRNGEKLILPKNLCIWATMNTSDQSLFPIDSAFKRRWEWRYMKIKDEGKDYKVRIGGEEQDWWEFVEKINKIIASMTSSADKQIGYFFCKADRDGIISEEMFVGKVLFYLWNDVFKDYGFEDNSLFRYEENGEMRDLTFPDFYSEEGKVESARVRGFVERVKEWKKEGKDKE